MATIVTRAGKGSALTNAEVDANFENLNTELALKLIASDLAPYLTSSSAAATYLTQSSASAAYQPILVSGTSIKTVNGNSLLGSGNVQIDGGVTSFNTRTGAVTLSSGDVTTALGFTPASESGSYTNPAWLTSLAWSKVTGTPSTVAGYGITDVYTKTAADLLLAAKRNFSENVQVISSNTTAVAFSSYVLTASLTLSLPASPNPGDWVIVQNSSGTTTAVIGRNGRNIMSLAEDMTIDASFVSLTLTYADATRGWVFG